MDDAAAIEVELKLFQIYLSLRANYNLEGRTDIFLAFHGNFAPHFLNDKLANAEAEARSRRINFFMSVEFHEVHKDIWQLVGGDSDARVLYFDGEFNVTVN